MSQVELPRPAHEWSGVVASGLAGMAVGGYIGPHIPARIALAPDVNTQVSLISEPGVTAVSGTAQFTAPHAQTHPLLDQLGMGIQIDAKQLPSPDSFEQYAALFTNFESAIGEPVLKTVLTRLAEGASVGTTLGLAFGLGILAVRRLHAENKSLNRRCAEFDQKIGGLERPARGDQLQPEIFIQPKKRLEKAARAFARKRTAVWCSAMLALGGTAYAAHEATTLVSPIKRDMVTLNHGLAERYPVLRGARVSKDPIGTAFNTAAHEMPIFIENAKSHGRKSAGNFESAWNDFAEKEGIDFSQENPNEVRILHITDTHCSDFFTNNTLEPLLQKMQPNIIAITGDVFAHAGTLPYEKGCISDVVRKINETAKALDITIDIVFVRGNHDTHDPVKGAANLDSKHPVAKLQGLTFVGKPDPTTTYIWKPTTPTDAKELQAAIAKQGADIAKVACEITDETGTPPTVVMAHRRRALDPTIGNGCAVLAINGHTHHTGKIKAYKARGRSTMVLQHTGGSASGADAGVPKVDTPKQDAAVSLMIFDKRLWQFNDDFITPVFHTDGSVTITRQSVPAQPRAVK